MGHNGYLVFYGRKLFETKRELVLFTLLNRFVVSKTTNKGVNMQPETVRVSFELCFERERAQKVFVSQCSIVPCFCSLKSVFTSQRHRYCSVWKLGETAIVDARTSTHCK